MRKLFVPAMCLMLAFSCFALSACGNPAEDEAAEMIQSIELSGVESYGDNHSVSEIQSNISNYSEYMTDEEMTMCLEALGVAKCKEYIINYYQSRMKDPGSFEVVSYETTLYFSKDDGNEYYLSSEMTYSGTNSYGARMQKDSGLICLDFAIDQEGKTASVVEGSLISSLSLGL